MSWGRRCGLRWTEPLTWLEVQQDSLLLRFFLVLLSLFHLFFLSFFFSSSHSLSVTHSNKYYKLYLNANNPPHTHHGNWYKRVSLVYFQTRAGVFPNVANSGDPELVLSVLRNPIRVFQGQRIVGHRIVWQYDRSKRDLIFSQTCGVISTAKAGLLTYMCSGLVH